MFDMSMDQVVLIKKHEPAWQAGYLNGPGDEVRPDESPIDAVVRSFEAATGLSQLCWVHFLTLRVSESEEVMFYAAPSMQYTVAQGKDIVIARVTSVSQMNVLSGLKWIIPLAVYVFRGPDVWKGTAVMFLDQRVTCMGKER